MGNQLHPCGACARHIRTDEAACPFCGAPVPEGFGPAARPKLSPPVSRAALLFVGATAATGCGGSTTTGSPVDSGGQVDVAQDAPVADSTTPTPEAGQDAAEELPVAAYGPAPMPDASTQDAADEQLPVAAYGPGPIPDAGTG